MQLLERPAPPDDADLVAVDEDLGRKRAGVVLARHREAVGAGVEEDDEVARLGPREEPPLGEDVPGLADVAGDVEGHRRGRLPDDADAVLGAVERRAHEGVEAGVDVDEGLHRGRLHRVDAGDHEARLRDEEAPRLDPELRLVAEEGDLLLPDRLERLREVLGAHHRLAVAEGDPQAAAEVDEGEADAEVFLQLADEGEHLPGGFLVRVGRGDLRADVAVDAGDGDVREGLRRLVALPRDPPVEVDAELRLGAAGVDLVERVGVDAGVDPEGDPGGRPEPDRGGGDLRELVEVVDVQEDVVPEGEVDLGRALGGGGEEDVAPPGARAEGGADLSLGDDLGGEALGEDEPDDLDVRVRLQGVPDPQLREAGAEGGQEGAGLLADRLRVVDVEGRAVLGGEPREGGDGGRMGGLAGAERGGGPRGASQGPPAPEALGTERGGGGPGRRAECDGWLLMGRRPILRPRGSAVQKRRIESRG